MRQAARGPVEEATREETRDGIWRRARDLLSEEQYMALWLFYVDEIPAGDVARILNRSWVSVKTLLHRARKKLHPVLAELGPDGMDRDLDETMDASRALGVATVKAGE